MTWKLTRRRALSGLGVGFAAPWFLARHTSAASHDEASVFQHGVASGDPDADSVVLWTRITSSDPSSGPSLSVQWEIATDEAFADRISSGQINTGPDRDFTVKVVADGLMPDRIYYYRFQVSGAVSPVGRTRTLPTGSLQKLGIAVASCSNYPFGYFNAYEAIALDPDVDLVLHLGDYLYEYGPDGFGGETGEALGRQHVPDHEIITLADYRTRHAQYKADPQSRQMHAAHPLIAVWDDHEFANNPWTGGAENHQPETEGSWEDRRRVSLRAYYEWMPIREPQPGTDSAAYWRHYQFGDLASLVTLETRHTGRSRQIDYLEHADALETEAGTRHFLDEVLGDPSRDMLSPDMQTFLEESLAASVSGGVRWQILGNQIPLARTASPRLSPGAFERLAGLVSKANLERAQGYAARGDKALPLYLDTWDGYPAARERLYAQARRAGVPGLIVLTGDSHSFWFNELQDGSGRPAGVELGTSGISSPGDFKEFGRAGAELMDDALIDTNPEVVWTEGIHNGYLRVTLSPERAIADYLAIDTVTDRVYSISRLKRFEVTPGATSLAWREV